MPFTPFKVDSSFENFGGRGRPYVSEGNYLFEVQGCEASDEARDGDSFWRWALRIVAGPDAVGRIFHHVAMWGDQKQWNNARLVHAISTAAHKRLVGYDFRSYDVFHQVAEQVGKSLAGKRLGGYVADGEPHLNRPTSDIKEIFSEQEYHERVKHQPPPSVGPVSQPTGQPSVNSSAPAETPSQQESLADEIARLIADQTV